MTRERIQQEAETFFDWPSENKKVVTLTSCLLFAEHIAKKAIKELENDYLTGRRARP